MTGEHTPASSDLPRSLGKPALGALRAAGYVRLEQIADTGEIEISRLHGVGPKAMEQLRRALAAKGLSFVR
jgi:hypothetical protein